MTLHGTEHWAFRIILDRRTGAILDAETLDDDLDLAVIGVPGRIACRDQPSGDDPVPRLDAAWGTVGRARLVGAQWPRTPRR